MPDFQNPSYLFLNKESFRFLNKIDRRSKMKNLLILFGFFLLSTSLFAQYLEVTIMEIQYQDSLGSFVYFENDSASAYEGDTVTVTGMVMVPPNIDHDPANGYLMYFGTTRRGFYMQDTSGATEWAGLLVLMESPSPEFEILDSGTVVKVTGVVTEYDDGDQKTTELVLIGFDQSNVVGFQDKPEPILLTLDSLKEKGTNTSKWIAEKWEGSYIEFRDVIVFEHTGSGGFRISDDNSTQFNIYTRSSNYYQSTPPPLGARLEYIRGFVETRSENMRGVSINPAFPEDIKVLSLPPTISDVTRNRVEVHSGETVTVTATIVDPDGIVTDAKLYYRENRGSVHNELTMNNTGGDSWQTTIPAFNDSTLIDFFIRAVDDSNKVSLSPADTSRNRYFYMVLDRPLTIQDVQYSPFGSGYSAYNEYEVSVKGIVTADINDLTGTETGTILGPMVYIQNGYGNWSGIQIYGTEAENVRRGDEITVNGPVNENYYVTRIGNNTTNVAITLHSTGNALPEPVPIYTTTIADLTSDAVQAEQWEGVLVKYENITVTDENADGSPGPHGGGNTNYGDILVKDSTVHDTRVGLQYGTHQYHNVWADSLASLPIRVMENDTFESITGIMWYGFYHYRLLPRKNDDFVGHVSDVNYENEAPERYSLTQNYPNPFNPSTKINYSLPVEANVTLKVFNILGQEVITLIDNEQVAAGNHEITFNASSIPTGIYLYRIQAGDFVQTKKMMLLK